MNDIIKKTLGTDLMESICILKTKDVVRLNKE